MMEAAANYLRTLLTAGFLSCAVRLAIPDRIGGKPVRLVCGLLVFVAAAGPLLRLDPVNLAEAIGRIEIGKVESNLDFTIDNDQIMADIIKEKAESYISNQAVHLHMSLQSVCVVVEKRGEYPYPAAAIITGFYTQQQRNELTEWIETNLAIPQEKQNWATASDSPTS